MARGTTWRFALRFPLVLRFTLTSGSLWAPMYKAREVLTVIVKQMLLHTSSSILVLDACRMASVIETDTDCVWVAGEHAAAAHLLVWQYAPFSSSSPAPCL